MGKHWIAGMALALAVVAWGAGPGGPGRAQAATLEGRVDVFEEGLFFGTNDLEDNSNAVVFIAGFTEGPPADRTPKLIQEDKSFSQRVLAITQGQAVVFPNRDPIHHNVWSKSKARSFDLGLYKYPESKTITFPDPGIVTVFCNIHPQMIATILVLPNTRYAVTPESGRYRIEGVPPGRHTVFAWVEGATPVRKVLEFREGNTVEADFRLQLKRIPVDHLNKEGEPYKKKDDYTR